MRKSRTKRKWKFYTCGRCKGSINYLATDNPPEVCPECGYGYSQRDYHDVPDLVRLNLNNLHTVGTPRFGKLEQTTITSR
jgi:DNA-directed RNA polymerase subunit RPC12/RpoP